MKHLPHWICCHQACLTLSWPGGDNIDNEPVFIIDIYQANHSICVWGVLCVICYVVKAKSMFYVWITETEGLLYHHFITQEPALSMRLSLYAVYKNLGFSIFFFLFKDLALSQNIKTTSCYLENVTDVKCRT